MGFQILVLTADIAALNQQAAQLTRAAFGQASATGFVTGVIRSGVETGERDERIRIAERNSLQRVGQCHAHQGADSHNGLQTLLRFLVLQRMRGDR